MKRKKIGVVLPIRESLKFFFESAEEEGEIFGKGGRECTGFKALDGAGISFLEPGVTFVGAPPANLQTDFLISISLRQALSQGRDALFISIGKPANNFIIKSLSQMTNVHNSGVRHLELDAKKFKKLSKSVSRLKNAPLSVCEIPLAKKSWIERSVVRHLKNRSCDRSLPPLLVIDGIEEVGKGFNGKSGKKAYKDFARFLKFISEITNSHIITDWPVNISKYSESRARLHDVVMYRWIVKKEFQVITVFWQENHKVPLSSRNKFYHVLLDCYGPRRHCSAPVPMPVLVGGLRYKDRDDMRHC